MSNDVTLMIAATDIRPACKDEPDVVERVRKAFVKAQGFWGSTDEDVRFRGALAAVLLETTDEAEKERVIASKRALDRIDHLLRGAKMGLGMDLAALETANEEAPKDVIPLMKLWHEAKATSNTGRAA